jgi:hypothetical protein
MFIMTNRTRELKIQNAEFKRVNETRGAFEGKFIRNYKHFL